MQVRWGESSAQMPPCWISGCREEGENFSLKVCWNLSGWEKEEYQHKERLLLLLPWGNKESVPQTSCSPTLEASRRGEHTPQFPLWACFLPSPKSMQTFCCCKHHTHRPLHTQSSAASSCPSVRSLAQVLCSSRLSLFLSSCLPVSHVVFRHTHTNTHMHPLRKDPDPGRPSWGAGSG
jgi:hypothetical protein